MGSLFPSLPDELGWECLLRVDLNYHHNVRRVSKSWNAALKSPQFYLERKRLKISEQRICMFERIDDIRSRVTIYDPEKNSWKALAPIPAQTDETFLCHFYFVKQKLVLITDWLYTFERRSCTWLYDFSCSKWRKGRRIPRWVEGFASAVDEQGGLVYVCGGISHDMRSNQGVLSAAVYNVEEDKWDILPDMNTHTVSDQGVFADGKFHVMGDDFEQNFQVFDPSTKSWKTMENRLNSWNRLVSTNGCFKGFFDKGLIDYDCRLNKLPRCLTGGIKFSLVIGDKIFLNKWTSRNEEDEIFYLVEPPSERGGVIKWSRLDRPSGFRGRVIYAVTLDL